MDVQGQRTRNAHQRPNAVGVLTGYDLDRERVTDTSSWPYRDTLSGEKSSADRRESRPARGNSTTHPTKPWGW